MNGCVALASIIGPQRTESELLTQVWEQIAEKYAERRALVVDSCGALAGYAQSELRQSLILSILQQMSEDRSTLVREAVARNLSILIGYFESGEKYAQVEQLFTKLLLQDTEPDVVNAARSQLLFALADWTDLHDSFHSKLLSMLLTEIQVIVMVCTYLMREPTLIILFQKNEGAQEVLTDRETHQLQLLLSSFVALVPRLKECVFSANPAITVCVHEVNAS